MIRAHLLPMLDAMIRDEAYSLGFTAFETLQHRGQFYAIRVERNGFEFTHKVTVIGDDVSPAREMAAFLRDIAEQQDRDPIWVLQQAAGP